MPYLLQSPSNEESRTVAMAAMLQTPSVPVRYCTLEHLPQAEELRDFDLVVGSVEFMREVFTRLGVPEPENLSYPLALRSFLLRPVFEINHWSDAIDPALGLGQEFFVKPMHLKRFTGFVAGRAPQDMDSHDAEQFEVFRHCREPMWASPAIKFQCEWRFYIQQGKVIGAGRYDPEGAEDAPVPDSTVVQAAVAAFEQAPCAYSLDFAVDEFGQTVLVEGNDAWALGLYDKALSARDYATFLQLRYQEIVRLS